MVLTHYDRVFLVPPQRQRPAPTPPEEPGIGRSPRFAPGWWLAGTAIFYAAVAMVCILAL
jgi:hypothetical protein